MNSFLIKKTNYVILIPKGVFLFASPTIYFFEVTSRTERQNDKQQGQDF